MSSSIYIGDTLLDNSEAPVSGSFVDLDGEANYRISNSDRLSPFLMSIVSDSDHWLFISSNGALTAGRRDPDSALFPYYTDDKIHDSHGLTGSKTILLVNTGNRLSLWEPFSSSHRRLYRIQQNLYKSVAANCIRFEEINLDLGISYWYSWSTSERFGFVKQSGLRNIGDSVMSVRVLDGIQNVLPSGVDRRLQDERSTLVDAYKKAELDVATGLCVLSLSSVLVDKPEPAESLRATTIWSRGLGSPGLLISTRQLDAFRQGHMPVPEEEIRAERGAFFVCSDLDLAPEESAKWMIVSDVDQGPETVANLVQQLSEARNMEDAVLDDIAAGTDQLKRIVSGADGLQVTSEEITCARHFSNVLFNLMRGGAIDNGYVLDRTAFADYVETHNNRVFSAHQDAISGLPDIFLVSALRNWSADQGDSDLQRLCDEYLPLFFSRRHGDPSRPWNRFSIASRKPDGSRRLYFEGNWRDIFQNWEALGVSFPEYISSFLSKFVNASTADGYNPYRITSDGIEWEVEDPTDPWSFIGYWGDHQIVYLLKLLELYSAHYPGELVRLLDRKQFAYANVPYRINSYASLLTDPHRTITFDSTLDEVIRLRVDDVGADGKLVWNGDGRIVHVNLAEKLLLPVLVKLSNFIPGAGIWMNTQRPEWNDANNALVGFGASMVTLCYLRRYILFMRSLLEDCHVTEFEVSSEVAEFFAEISRVLISYRHLLDVDISDVDRKQVLDALGSAGGSYRETVYDRGFSGLKTSVTGAEIIAFVDSSVSWIDHSIRGNRRGDKLFHSYNLITFQGEAGISVRHLYEMLEGQVAVLSSGLLTAHESIEVLGALRNSDLYREDQNSYLLYPDRHLPIFLEKNRLPPDMVSDSVLVEKLDAAGDTRLLVKDVSGAYHFNGSFRNATDVEQMLAKLEVSGYADEVAADRRYVLDLFERLFDHQSFTGRSGTFFGYEGLGCIYWHMVSKLLLAVSDTVFRVSQRDVEEPLIEQLADSYYDIRGGIGQDKSPMEYGAFPMDPYSHTPGNAGAQQPGMTGQVKEDILARWRELGIEIVDGSVRFRPELLRIKEFITEPASYTYIDHAGAEKKIQLEPHSLAFTYCQVPVIYHQSADERIVVSFSDRDALSEEGLKLNASFSHDLFSRSGQIQRMDVYWTPGR